MKWVSSLAKGANLSEAVMRAASIARYKLGAETPDLLIAFASHHYAGALAHVPTLLQEHVPARVMIGSCAGGVIGNGEEVEDAPAVSLCAACLPGVDIAVSHRTTEGMPDEDAPPNVWRAWLGVPASPAGVVVLADPFTTRMDGLIAGLDYALPGVPKIGGLVSGGRKAGDSVIWVNGAVYSQGAALLALSGEIEVDTVVAQGCRPIGRTLNVTRCDQNVLLEVDREPPLRYLAALVEQLSEEDRHLMRHSLFIGIEMDPLEKEPKPGEFLIRNLVGIDYQTGRLAVGAMLREGQRVQFHLRDRRTSAEDVERQLRQAREGTVPRPAGSLLFSCLGRGAALYQAPNYESRCFADIIGGVPPAGFFCNGEIGPVGGSTYVHGYTSCFGLFRERSGGAVA